MNSKPSVPIGLSHAADFTGKVAHVAYYWPFETASGRAEAVARKRGPKTPAEEFRIRYSDGKDNAAMYSRYSCLSTTCHFIHTMCSARALGDFHDALIDI